MSAPAAAADLPPAVPRRAAARLLPHLLEDRMSLSVRSRWWVLCSAAEDLVAYMQLLLSMEHLSVLLSKLHRLLQVY